MSYDYDKKPNWTNAILISGIIAGLYLQWKEYRANKENRLAEEIIGNDIAKQAQWEQSDTARTKWRYWYIAGCFVISMIVMPGDVPMKILGSLVLGTWAGAVILLPVYLGVKYFIIWRCNKC